MKPRRTDPTNTNVVSVLDKDSNPLMPTRPSRARRLIRQGRANKRWVKGMFTIQMTDVSADGPDTVVGGVDLNIDPGASATGIAVTSETPAGRRAHTLIEVRHRGQRVKNKLERRRSLRRNRRGRLRNRKRRFNNRHRPDGWLPPSIQSRLANTLTWVKQLSALYPVRHIRVETAVFDTQLMQNAEISGEQYQHGALHEWQLRSYVFHRDGRRCAYCGTTKAERYELDHIAPKSSGGSNRPSNLVVSCQSCNLAKANTPVETFLTDRPTQLAAIYRIQRAPLAGATHLNVILPELLRRLRTHGYSVSTHDSYTTSWTRRRLGVYKTHANDALCLESPDKLDLMPNHTLVIQPAGHGDRQMLRPPDRHGNPRGIQYSRYCALPRQQQGYTSCPGHRRRNRRAHGIASGDIVRFTHPRYGTLTGHAILDKVKARVAINHDGHQISVSQRHATLVARNTGYRTLITNTTQNLSVRNQGDSVQP